MAYREDTGTLAPARRLDDGRLIVEATLTRSGVFVYHDLATGAERREYRPPAEVTSKKSMDSLKMVPVTDDHPPTMINAENADRYAAGQVGENVRIDGIHLVAPLAINRAVLVKKMDRGKREVSCGYDCDLEMTAGISPDGEKYDAVQTNIMYNHVAIVDAGRAGSARARMDGAHVDSAYQVIPHRVTTYPCDPDGVCAWVASSDMTADELLAKVNAALANVDGITVSVAERQDAKTSERKYYVGSRSDSGTVRIERCYSIAVRVSSRSMTPDQLNALLSEALSASPDLHIRTDSTKENVMDLTQALAALAAAQEKLGAANAEIASQKGRADAADQKAKDVERQLVEAQAATATERQRADQAIKDKDAADKARTDAAADFTKKVGERVQLEAAAIGALGRNDKAEVLGPDGKTVIDISKMDERALRCAVVEKLDGYKVPAERSDDAVALAFELATARASKAGNAHASVREVLITGNRADTTPANAEDAARAKMRASTNNAWKTDSSDAVKAKQ